MNPASLFKLKGAWNAFSQNHPKFPAFVKAVSTVNVGPGTVLDLKVTTADGKCLQTNVKLTESDMELIRSLKDLV